MFATSSRYSHSISAFIRVRLLFRFFFFLILHCQAKNLNNVVCCEEKLKVIKGFLENIPPVAVTVLGGFCPAVWSFLSL